MQGGRLSARKSRESVCVQRSSRGDATRHKMTSCTAVSRRIPLEQAATLPFAKKMGPQLLLLHDKKLPNLHCGCIPSNYPGMRIMKIHTVNLSDDRLHGQIGLLELPAAGSPSPLDPTWNNPRSRLPQPYPKGSRYRNQVIGVVH
jgi:hypothetical protein